jgi:beta-1,2-mannobiose phosphorylase / 1,2-beta-oligomannan phosphorylase
MNTMKKPESIEVRRYKNNPIITPADVLPSRPDLKVECVFNAGVTRFKDEVLLLLRVAESAIPNSENIIKVPYYDYQKEELVIESFDRNDRRNDYSDSRYVRTPGRLYLTSISHFRIARSRDGFNFTIDETPAMSSANVYEMYGIEDPRITCMDGCWYINYSAISSITGVTTCLASTKNFIEFDRKGVIFTPDNKDICIFPEKINGKYYAFSRPASAEYDLRDMWVAESPDLVCWGNHRFVMSARDNMWDNGRIGCSAVPIKTDKGWLEIYHGASKDNCYSLGASLHRLDDPAEVIARSTIPLLKPEEEYELYGFFGNVIFCCGVLFEENLVKIYYGAADTVMAYAEVHIDEIFNNLRI